MTDGSGLWTTAPHTQTTLRAGATTVWSRWGKKSTGMTRRVFTCVCLGWQSSWTERREQFNNKHGVALFWVCVAKASCRSKVGHNLSGPGLHLFCYALLCVTGHLLCPASLLLYHSLLWWALLPRVQCVSARQAAPAMYLDSGFQ